MSDPPAPLPPHAQRCSFCHKARAELRALVAGPEISICDECVQLAIQILLDRSADPVPDDAACSFCHKMRAEVRILVPGPGINICDECVQLSSDVLTGSGDLSVAHAEALAEAGYIGGARCRPPASG